MSNNPDTFRTCPACGQLLPISRVRCDCGHYFEPDFSSKESELKKKSLHFYIFQGISFLLLFVGAMRIASFIKYDIVNLIVAGILFFPCAVFVARIPLPEQADDIKRLPELKEKSNEYDRLNELLRLRYLSIPLTGFSPRNIRELSEDLYDLNSAVEFMKRTGDWPKGFPATPEDRYKFL